MRVDDSQEVDVSFGVLKKVYGEGKWHLVGFMVVDDDVLLRRRFRLFAGCHVGMFPSNSNG